MAKELSVQTDIKKSVIAQGGYAVKLSNRFTIGIPDLFVALYPFAPCLLEVKDLGEVVEGFDRKIEVTPKQRDTMQKLDKVYEWNLHQYTPNRHAAAVLLSWREAKTGNGFLGIAPWGAERTSQIVGTVTRMKSGLIKYELTSLMEAAGLCKVMQ